jgi:hypothetical protein
MCDEGAEIDLVPTQAPLSQEYLDMSTTAGRRLY